MNRRDRFAAWFRALSLGKKWAVGFGTFVAAYLIIVPLSNVVYLKVLNPPEQTVGITCGDRSITIKRDDPIFDENDLEASAVRTCDRAWGRA